MLEEASMPKTSSVRLNFWLVTDRQTDTDKLTWVSIPSSIIMTKNRKAHSADSGICSSASGYTTNISPGPVTETRFVKRTVPCGGSVAEWLACWTQAQKGPGSNRSRDAVG